MSSQIVTPIIEKPCPIYIDRDLLLCKQLIDCCIENSNHYAIITDDNVKSLYASQLIQHFNNYNLDVQLISIPAGEGSKTRNVASFIQDQFFELGFGRDTCIIALGGGVISDLAGYVAATYCRGVPIIYLPTTLMAMVDASIGGKTGVNTSYGKNLVGVFSQPKTIFSDINTLSTLPDSEYISAFPEVIKHALIYDDDFFNFLLNNAEAIRKRDPSLLKIVIEKSCSIKLAIVNQDERESGIRVICNFGHTVGHALEKITDYSVSHGIAVAIGLLVESYISVKLGLLSKSEFEKIREIIENFRLILRVPCNIKINDLKESLILDKKTKNKLPMFVLLKRIGETYLNNLQYTMKIDNAILNDGLDYMISEFVR